MNETEEMLKSLRKELKITRYCTLFTGVLLLAVLIGGIYIMNKIEPALVAVREMQPVMEQMEELDIGLLNEKIEQLDMEGLNEMVKDLDAAELSEALKNINDAAAMLKEAGESISEFSNSISGSFSGLFGR